VSPQFDVIVERRKVLNLARLQVSTLFALSLSTAAIGFGVFICVVARGELVARPLPALGTALGLQGFSLFLFRELRTAWHRVCDLLRQLDF
jgi:hypothetical protein